MSFILDALKRSERARRVLGATLPPPPNESVSAPRRAWFIGLTLLLLANAALLAWFVLRPSAAEIEVSRPSVGGEVRSLAREAGGDDSAMAAAATSAAPLHAPPPLPVAEPMTPAELDPALRERVATFHVDVHGWADAPDQRFVVINLKRHVIGDALGAGTTLVDIVADGVVIEIEGRRVLLPRQ